ncbi:MAG: polysaccharide export protein [Elusimicrobia bacterium]|nr:polysaccharide export protein [Elusimicrobiota bacterium]
MTLSRRLPVPLFLAACLLAGCAGLGPSQAPGAAGSSSPGIPSPAEAALPGAPKASPPTGEEEAIRAALQKLKKPDRADYHINPTDLVTVTVFQQPELERKLRVSQNGTVSLPLIGNVKIGGMTLDQAEALVADKYKEFVVSPQVTLFISEYAQRKIYVLGEVKAPGSFDLPVESQLTVLEAVTMAGGFTNIAAPDRTKVVRMRDGESQSITIEVSAITKRGEKHKDIPLEPNDVIFVPQSYF